jgi:hypothetical protein
VSSQTDISAETAAALLLVGESHAFGLVAGRCSAAQAAGIRRLREEKLYKPLASDWREFCTNYLKMTGSNADRIIRLLEEFGPGYFEVSQLIRITPETYRLIEPSVKDNALRFDGEAIQLRPENARKVAGAIAEMRKAAAGAKQPRPLDTHKKLAQIDRQCSAIVKDLQEISSKERDGENWLQFTATVSRIQAALARIAAENGL